MATRPPSKILIIDDSLTSLAYAKAVLEGAGYDVRTHGDVWVAVKANRFQPDLVLIDVNMGPSNGSSVTRALRRLSSAAETAIVLYSSLSSEDLEVLAEDCGADGFIRKTDDQEGLLNQVREFLK